MGDRGNSILERRSQERIRESTESVQRVVARCRRMGGRDWCWLLRLCPSSSQLLIVRYFFADQTEDLLSSPVQVKHPFTGVSSERVAKRLASKVGVIALPGSFFSPPFENAEDDSYIRFCESSRFCRSALRLLIRAKRVSQLSQTSLLIFFAKYLRDSRSSIGYGRLCLKTNEISTDCTMVSITSAQREDLAACTRRVLLAKSRQYTVESLAGASQRLLEW